MKTPKKIKLTLKKETLRTLSSTELGQVAGGRSIVSTQTSQGATCAGITYGPTAACTTV